ncbi:MAG: TonB-dependent receptor, partial [Gammaproteobacteria bacterium]|nr:TonB-dependent receptor [Gammaproteobacteria bacterium]
WDDSGDSAQIDSMFMIDAEIAYQVTPEFTLKFGASNLLDEYPDEIGADNANRLSVGLQYPRRAAANYEGRSVYMGASYNY